MTVVLELRGVSKSYGVWHPRPALREVWLRVERGECFGLAGPNGAGKSTLIRILLGLSSPDDGDARLFGEAPENPELRRRVGFVPEAAELPPTSTPKDLVRRWVKLRGLSPRAFAQGLESLDRLGMSPLLDQPAGKLSKGERQRALWAMALLGQPELLILDEPTDGLDPLGRALVRQLIREECAAGRTVFLNSHLLAETERVCTRVAILHQGRLVREERLEPVREGGGGTSVVLLDTAPSAALLKAASAQLVPPASHAMAELVRERPGVKVLVEHPDAKALNQSVDALRSEGAMLLELRLVRADLESALVEATEQPKVDVSAASAVPAVPAWASEPVPALPAVSPNASRTLVAIGRVAREIAADLASQKVGWMMLLVALLSMAGLFRLVQSELLVSLAEASRSAVQQFETLQLANLTREVSSVSTQVLIWLLWSLSTMMSSLFVVPLLDPRRTVLIYAQPFSRSDFALGLFFGVVLLTGASAFVYAGLSYGALRWLGLPVSPQYFWLPVPVMLGFAPLSCVVLLATFVRRSGFFAAICGLGTLAALANLGTRDSVAPGAEPSLALVTHALSPKLVELSKLAGHVAEGGHWNWSPLVSTALIDVALVLLVVTVARRRES